MTPASTPYRVFARFAMACSDCRWPCFPSTGMTRTRRRPWSGEARDGSNHLTFRMEDGLVRRRNHQFPNPEPISLGNSAIPLGDVRALIGRTYRAESVHHGTSTRGDETLRRFLG